MTGSPNTRLVLLTHQYPYSYGDASFISRQIEAFADKFDEVAILTYKDIPDTPLLSLPPNCVFYGAINPRRITSQLRGALFLPGWPLMLKQAFSNSSIREILRDMKASLIGMSIANHPAVKRFAIEKENGVRTVVYSFWGRDMGYSLPWIGRSFEATAVGLHGYDLYEERNGRVPLQRMILRTAKRIFPASHAGRQYILAKHKWLNRSKVEVRYLGVEGGTRNSSPRHYNQIEVVSCSFIIELKRVSQILKAVQELSARRGRVRWTHFGGGQLEAQVVHAAEVAMKENKNLIIDIRGNTENTIVVNYYQENFVSVFVTASRTEGGVPVSIMEAASFGIPTVATNVGGVPEIVGEQFGTGILVDADPSAQSIADAMEKILDAPIDQFDPHAYWQKCFDSRINSRILADDLFDLLTF